MKTTPINKEQAAYNKAVVQTYFKLLKVAKDLLASIEEEPLRYSLTRVEKHKRTKQLILHDFVTPLLYLRLDLYPNDEMAIHFGFELLPTVSPYYGITSKFIRMIYKLTMNDGSAPNIENAIRNDWVVINVSEAYEHLEERGLKHHQFELIKHKPRQVKRKLTRAA